VVKRVEQLLIWRKFDAKQVEENLKNVLPDYKGQWPSDISRPYQFLLNSWYHPIFKLQLHHLPGSPTVPVVWSWENRVWVIDSWEEFRQFVNDEQLSLADEGHREDILTVFSCFQQRNIIGLYPSQPSDPPEKQELFDRYPHKIQPPHYTQMEEKDHLKVWTIDKNSPGESLEEWEFIQQGNRFEVQVWVREEEFGSQLLPGKSGADFRPYSNIHQIPPEF
jgi:hypothetical protein